MSGSFGPSNNGGSINLASPVAIGNVTPNAITATNLTATGSIVTVPGSTQVLTTNSTINPTSSIVPISSNSAITLTNNPQISTGVNGQKITLINVGNHAITLTNGNGLMMQTGLVLYSGKSIEFTYHNFYNSWVSDFTFPETVTLTGINNHLYDHDNPGWRVLTLTSNWVNFGSGFMNASIKRIGRDLINVQGVILVSGSYNSLITTFPTDCRPSTSMSFIGASGIGLNQLTLTPSGQLTSATTMTPGQFQVITFSYSL